MNDINHINFETYLLETQNLKTIEPLIQLIVEQAEYFDMVFDLMWHSNRSIAWRAAWICEKTCERQPDFLQCSHFDRLNALVLSTENHSVIRLSLNMILVSDFLTIIHVELLNACYYWLSKIKFPVAIQALSLRLIVRYCNIEPNLTQELFCFLQNMKIENYPAGMISVHKKTMNKLAKLIGQSHH